MLNSLSFQASFSFSPFTFVRGQLMGAERGTAEQLL
jgi:hypothetical protein